MEKTGNYIILAVTTGIGSYIPTFFGAGYLSGWSLLCSVIGGGIGVYFIYQLNN